MQSWVVEFLESMEPLSRGVLGDLTEVLPSSFVSTILQKRRLNLKCIFLSVPFTTKSDTSQLRDWWVTRGKHTRQRFTMGYTAQLRDSASWINQFFVVSCAIFSSLAFCWPSFPFPYMCAVFNWPLNWIQLHSDMCWTFVTSFVSHYDGSIEKTCIWAKPVVLRRFWSSKTPISFCPVSFG